MITQKKKKKSVEMEFVCEILVAESKLLKIFSAFIARTRTTTAEEKKLFANFLLVDIFFLSRNKNVSLNC